MIRRSNMKNIRLLATALLGLALSSCGDFVFDIIEETSQVDTIAEAKEYYYGAKAFIEEGSNLLYFGDHDEGVSVCIDSGMGEELVGITILAVQEYDALDYISLNYHLGEDGCGDSEVIRVTTYRDTEIDICSDDDKNVIGCNEFYYQQSTGNIVGSTIYYNLNIFDEVSYEEKLHTAVHELGHTFGLVDLYDELLESVSIMYYSLGEIVLTSLTEWDESNLAWMYDR
jgi:hypothetical protein